MAYLLRKTKNLIVRPLRLSDYKVWKEAFLKTPLQRNPWDREPKKSSDLTHAEFKNILRNLKRLRDTDTFFDFAVFEKSSGAYVGSVAVMDLLRSISQSAYLGYFLINRFWGKGYGKEASLAAIDIAFRDLKLHRIEAGIEPQNRRSIFTARSMGLRKEGLKKRAIFKRGKWVDLVMYSATCEEFGIKWRGIPTLRR